MRSTKKSVVVAGLAIAGLALGACGGGTGAGTAPGGTAGATGEEAKTIKLVAAEYSKDHTKAFWDAFAKTYNEKTGYTLEVQVVSWDNIDQQSIDDDPEQPGPRTSSTSTRTPATPRTTCSTPRTTCSRRSKDDILDTFVKSGTYKGKFYGLPDLSSARALFYNKTLFKQAGIAAPPKTWAEFEADAKKITALGGGNVGYAMPLGPEEAQAEFSIWLVNNGGDWKTDGKWGINSHKNVETLDFLKKLADEKVTQNNPGKTNRTDGASRSSGPARPAWSSASRPLAADLDKDKKVDYGVAPLPTSDGDRGKTYGVTDYLMAFKKPGNEDAVKAFYDLYYQPDQVNTFIKAEGFLPVTKSGRQALLRREGAHGLPQHPARTRSSRRPTTPPGTRSSSPSSRTSAGP